MSSFRARPQHLFPDLPLPPPHPNTLSHTFPNTSPHIFPYLPNTLSHISPNTFPHPPHLPQPHTPNHFSTLFPNTSPRYTSLNSSFHPPHLPSSPPRRNTLSYTSPHTFHRIFPHLPSQSSTCALKMSERMSSFRAHECDERMSSFLEHMRSEGK